MHEDLTNKLEFNQLKPENDMWDIPSVTTGYVIIFFKNLVLFFFANYIGITSTIT